VHTICVLSSRRDCRRRRRAAERLLGGAGWLALKPLDVGHQQRELAQVEVALGAIVREDSLHEFKQDTEREPQDGLYLHLCIPMYTYID